VWIDQISLVRSQGRVETLDGLMLGRVKQNNFEFSPPEIIEWDRVPTFACGSDRFTTLRHEPLTKESLSDAVGAANLNALTIEQLKQLRVSCFYDDAVEPEFKWRAYDCVEMDLVDSGDQFVFAGGRWSLIAADFQQTVNNYIDVLKRDAPALLPAALGRWQQGRKPRRRGQVHQAPDGSQSEFDG
jgi:uncharacterized protein (TIGR04141 family)